MSSSPNLSVIVCSHNGAATLARTLRGVRAQLRAGDELLVVDDGSSDGTAAIAAVEGARVIGLSPNAGLAAARNAGVSEANASLLAFTDDDCEPCGGWLDSLREALTDPLVDGVGGRVVPGPGENFALRYAAARNPLVPLGARLMRSHRPAYRLALYLRGLVAADPEPANGADLYSVVGANMALRRSWVFALDGFDEAYRFGGEEEDLCRRGHARAEGATIRYVADAGVVHRFEPTLRDALRRSRAYGRGNARQAAKHPECSLIVFPFPLAVIAAAVTAVLARRPRLLAFAAIAPLGLYPRWIARAIGRRSPEAIAYPYLQLAQELATMRGELEGRRAGYVPAPARHLRADPDRPAGYSD